MKISYFKVNPTGNITLLVDTPVSRECQSAVAAKLMAAVSDAEQVGFFEPAAAPCTPLRLQMMGGEFCGNASISTAAVLLNGTGEEAFTTPLEVSGMAEDIAVSVKRNADGSFTGTVDMPIPEAIYDYTFINGFDTYTLPLVRFPGICHVIADKRLSPVIAEKYVADWCRQLKSEALGIMFFDKAKNTLEPFVYVASTDTAVWETSCASGTSAVAAYVAKLKRHSVSLSLRQAGGVLTAQAEYSANDVRRIRLTGSAVIEGKFEIELGT